MRSMMPSRNASSDTRQSLVAIEVQDNGGMSCVPPPTQDEDLPAPSQLPNILPHEGTRSLRVRTRRRRISLLGGTRFVGVHARTAPSLFDDDVASAALCRAARGNYAKSPTWPPVCQNTTVSSGARRPARTYAMSAAIAFAVY